MDSSALVLSSQLSQLTVGNKTDQDGSPQQARISDLHRLPLEMREKIYEFLFFPENQRGERSEVGKNGTILRTCRSIYLEARYILYRQTLWRITFGSPGPDLPYRSTSRTACLSRRQWSLPFFDFESRGADIYLPPMCKFHVHLNKISWPEDVRYQIDWLARNVLLEAAQPIKHFVLRMDFADDLSPLGNALVRVGDPRVSYYRAIYGSRVLEYVKATSAVLGGVLGNVEVARVHVEGGKRFPRAVTDPSVLGVTQAWGGKDDELCGGPSRFSSAGDVLGYGGFAQQV
ncbi:hypothetical protein V8F33_007532 [Rhypophila sp. PSN 637]